MKTVIIIQFNGIDEEYYKILLFLLLYHYAISNVVIGHISRAQARPGQAVH